MREAVRCLGLSGLCLALTLPCDGQAIQPSAPQAAPLTYSSLPAEVTQLAGLLKINGEMSELHTLQQERGCSAAPNMRELALRQQLLESVVAAELDVESAQAEIASEQADLGNLKTQLTERRDRTVSRLNTAALLTGSGAGAVASATQFSTLSSSANNAGDGIGLGSGVASTLLAYLAARRQSGPSASIQDTPNMLAPLFGRPSTLHTNYPLVVLAYLNSVPGGEAASRGTRLAQLKEAWQRSGRLSASGPTRHEDKVQLLTSSGDTAVRVDIHDLEDRVAMLGDVSGKIALMKRDLAELMRSYLQAPQCAAP